MAFWGVEIKPGKSFTLPSKNTSGRLRITHATLGVGSSKKSSSIQCNVGSNLPVLLCTLLPEKAESIHMEVDFEEAEEVMLSVIGPHSVHLTGYVVGKTRQVLVGDDASESFGGDIRCTKTEGSGDDNEYGGNFIDDDELSSPSHISLDSSSSEEVNGKKKANERQRLIKYKSSESEDNHVQIVDSDDDDLKLISLRGIVQGHEDSKSRPINLEDVAGPSISDSQSNDGKVTTRRLNIVRQRNHGPSAFKELRSRILKHSLAVQKEVINMRTHDLGVHDIDNLQSEDRNRKHKSDDVGHTTQSDDRKQKKKRKHETNALVEIEGTKTDLSSTAISEGLVIEDLVIGHGKLASFGRKVTIHYVGKLKGQDQVFCSTDEKSPLKFRLGNGDTLDGLHPGIEGMRVGGKRRLIIPPELGYGSQGNDGVPPNAWLVMDVELLKVR